MKRIFAVLLSVLLIAGAFSACSGGTESTSEPVTGKTEGKLSIVTTIFPEYDWVNSILGGNKNNASVTMLLDNGVDLHSYQPTAQDMIKISECDLFICIGGESDKWVDDVLKNTQNKKIKVLKLLDFIGDAAKEEEEKEGMQTEKEEEGEEEEYDEHIWLSLNNASLCVYAIADALSEIDSKNADEYKLNAKAYNDELVALDNEYKEAVKNAKTKTLIFGDRFPFLYMTKDYGLDYFAAFKGCSAESEASFETVSFLAGKVDELGVKNVVVIEGGDGKLAKTIIDNTKSKSAGTVVMNSMQNTTSKDVEAGASYLEIMKNNLESLKKALS